jgi:hypothetical protein
VTIHARARVSQVDRVLAIRSWPQMIMIGIYSTDNNRGAARTYKFSKNRRFSAGPFGRPKNQQTTPRPLWIGRPLGRGSSDIVMWQDAPPAASVLPTRPCSSPSARACNNARADPLRLAPREPATMRGLTLSAWPARRGFGLSDFQDFLRRKPPALVPRELQCFCGVLSP